MTFYDFNFNLLLVEPNVISWRLTKYYNAIGTFLAHLPLSSPATALLLEHDFLVAGIKGEFVIITGKQAEDELVIYGRTCNWLLSKRVLMPCEEVTTATGEYVSDIFSSCYKSSGSVIAGDIQEGAEHTFLREKKELLSDVIFGALEADGLGCELIFDPDGKCWRFDIINGKELALMISEANKNASATSVTKDISAYANICYFGENSEYVGDDSCEDILRFETFVESEDEQRAYSHLDALKKTDKTEAQAIGPLYKTDYFLGDSVRVQLIKGDYKATKRLRIKGVELMEKTTGYNEKPIFEEE